MRIAPSSSTVAGGVTAGAAGAAGGARDAAGSWARAANTSASRPSAAQAVEHSVFTDVGLHPQGFAAPAKGGVQTTVSRGSAGTVTMLRS